MLADVNLLKEEEEEEEEEEVEYSTVQVEKFIKIPSDIHYREISLSKRAGFFFIE